MFFFCFHSDTQHSVIYRVCEENCCSLWVSFSSGRSLCSDGGRWWWGGGDTLHFLPILHTDSKFSHHQHNGCVQSQLSRLLYPMRFSQWRICDHSWGRFLFKPSLTMSIVDCDDSQAVCLYAPPSFTQLRSFIAALDLIISQTNGSIFINQPLT